MNNRLLPIIGKKIKDIKVLGHNNLKNSEILYIIFDDNSKIRIEFTLYTSDINILCNKIIVLNDIHDMIQYGIPEYEFLGNSYSVDDIIKTIDKSIDKPINLENISITKNIYNCEISNIIQYEPKEINDEFSCINLEIITKNNDILYIQIHYATFDIDKDNNMIQSKYHLKIEYE
jgi:hypothetical protein